MDFFFKSINSQIGKDIFSSNQIQLKYCNWSLKFKSNKDQIGYPIFFIKSNNDQIDKFDFSLKSNVGQIR